jgi:hypothetical protein
VKITATISEFRQCSYEEYRTFYYSKTFELSATLEDVFVWATQHKKDLIHINEITFSSNEKDC